mgnify:CR=1 FL=1
MMNSKFKEIILEIQNNHLDKALILLEKIEVNDEEIESDFSNKIKKLFPDAELLKVEEEK